MTSRSQSSPNTSSSQFSSPASLPPKATSPARKFWVDPVTLPHHGNVSSIAGNVSDYIKQLIYNTYISYGVVDEDTFGYEVGKAVKFVEMNTDRKLEKQGRLEATTVAEVVVTKRMLNGAGMLHGGCVAYLIDNCCSTPLVVLGLVQDTNGIGVTQAMNVIFHAPAPLGTCLRIVSTSISLGGRVMTSRCEIIDKNSGRIVASAYLNKMQPKL